MSREQAVKEVLERAARVPDRFRRFEVGAETAARVHRIDGALLDEALDLGLAYEGSGADRRFDDFDLKNLGLGLRIPSPAWLQVRLSAQPFNAEAVGTVTYRTRFQGRVAGEALEPSSQLASGVVDGTLRRMGPDVFEADLHVSAGENAPDAGEGAADCARELGPVLPEAARLEYYLVPDELRDDVGFVRETRLADCRAGTTYLARVAEDAGAAVRPAGGLLLAGAFPLPHAWLEVRRGDRWLPADPYYLVSMAGYGLLDGERWPPHRSVAGTVWKICGPYADLCFLATASGGRPVKTSVRILRRAT
ncbi:hypothetical protein SBI_03122 [Streptomyces bingchenggensis BCW-1]|uniref:Transglutaminase-like domain-containing protein n=1 Tax=Streptomyces bingchenggensis (strain BCW-1) TaxID=749414 RepID=D7C6M6_STRBB|nr:MULTISPECIES: hypothetical protein [Streptomyces]ADI06243.1 hypothetical protein SBI_03122 [Streptomyces bingchenggensis BCW-1]